MTPVLVTSTGCQAGAYFDNDVIPPGVPRLRLPWAYSYAQLGALLTAYTDVHPEDFVTFGVLQAQPRRGSQCEWGEVAGVLAHMVGGRLLLVNQLLLIIRRIQRLGLADPMRAVEEEALVALVMQKRRRLDVPLGDGEYATLAAPVGPLAHAAPPRDPCRRPPQSASAPPPHRSTSPQPGPSGAQRGPRRPPQGFIDLTTEGDKDMDDTPATPSPNVSDSESEGTRTPMDTEDEDHLLHMNRDDSDKDGFQHV